MARILGATRIFATDINEYRLRAAQKFGADAVINAEEDVPARVRQLNEDRLADRVIVCTGARPAFNQALQSVDRGGTVLFFAVPEPGVDIPLPLTDLWRNEIALMTSYGASPADLSTALELIRARRVNVHDMITHRLSLAETGLSFKLMTEGKESLKVIINP
jgi:L-iditol 2-dehydrogenase